MNQFLDFKLNVPVLLIAFNRPVTTQKVFEYIRQARPKKLYVSVDNYRKDKPSEEELVNQVKKIVQNVNWPCETHYYFNNENRGAEVTVSSGISWTLENEEYVIILEDDIIAPISFLKFAQEMLIKYKDDDRIGTVTGSNFTPIPVPNNTDYFFAKYGHSWGWGTWKRTWDNFDLNVNIPDKHLNLDYLKTITNSLAEAKFYQKKFKALKQNGPGKSTWDHVGLYYHRINKRLSVIPCVNLTSNIGVYGLHANGETEHHFRPFDESFIVNNHPIKVECYTEYDIHHFNNYINKKRPFIKRLINKFKRILRPNF